MILPFRKTFSKDFHDIFLYQCYHGFSMSLGIGFGSMFASRWDQIPRFGGYSFLMIVPCVFEPRSTGPQKSQASLFQFFSHIELLCNFDVMVDHLLISCWHHFGSFGNPFGIIWDSSRAHFNITSNHPLFACIAIFDNVWQTVFVFHCKFQPFRRYHVF